MVSETGPLDPPNVATSLAQELSAGELYCAMNSTKMGTLVSLLL